MRGPPDEFVSHGIMRGREVEGDGGLVIRETNCYNILVKVEQLKPP
jgi:hypothetical protein